MKATVVTACAVIGCLAAPLAASDSSRGDSNVDAIVTDAFGAPPEFAADVLLRVAGSARVTSSATKRQLIDEAFMRAYGAPEPYRRTSARIPAESRQSADTQAYATGLNRVTLQVRAVQLMAAISPARALELFQWIDLDLAPAACGDALVPAVDEYYNAATVIARTAFGGSARGDALQFLEYYLWRAHLPTEMPAVALAVQRFRPSVEQSIHLETLLTALLERGSSDPRGFSAANFDIVGRLADLQFFDRERHVPGWFLMEALRAYVVKHLGGPRCADSSTETMLPAAFNGALSLLGVNGDVKPIDGGKIARARLLPAARIDLLWQSVAARQLHEAWLDLRGRDRNPVPDAARRTDSWRNAADRLITQTEQWMGRGEAAERGYFYEKATLFANVVDLAPVGPIRSRAVRSLVSFLRHEDTDRARRALWFVFVRRLLELANRDGQVDILEAMETSGNAVIALYARAERTFPIGSRPTDRTLAPRP